MKRGDVVLVRFPHPSGLRGKKRPAVIVQSDSYASVVSTVMVAEVTSNLTMASDPACLFIDTNTPDGRATGVPTYDEAREKFARDYLADNLQRTAGNVTQAARLAKRSRTDFYKLLARYRLHPNDFKNTESVGPMSTDPDADTNA